MIGFWLTLLLSLAAPAWASCVSSDPYSSAVCSDSPVSYYRLENPGSNTLETDHGSAALNLTYSSAGVAQNSGGQSCIPGVRAGNNCATFTASSLGYLGKTASAGPPSPCVSSAPANWAVELWVYGHEGGVDNGNAIASWSNPTTKGYQILWEQDGTAFFQIYNTGSAAYMPGLQSVAACPANTWCQFAITMTTSPVETLYVNGVSDQTSSTPTGTCQNESGLNFTIGMRDSTGSEKPVTGTMDEISLYNGLSGARITAHYTAGITVVSSGWPFTLSKPQLPRFRNDGYLTRLVRDGYNSGRFGSKIAIPQFLTVGYAPFDRVPRGDAR